MTTKIDELAELVLSASRKSFFRKKPIFELHKKVSSNELNGLEGKLKIALPPDLKSWLLTIGYGDINEELSFREDWLSSVSSGKLKGGVIFAQDILGNFYAFDESGRIYFLSRSDSIFALMEGGFVEFIKELIRRDYKLVDWATTLDCERYEWASE